MLLVGFAAAALVFLGLPVMAMSRTVVAERMDDYLEKQTESGRLSVGGYDSYRRHSRQRSTSMSSLPPHEEGCGRRDIGSSKSRSIDAVGVTRRMKVVSCAVKALAWCGMATLNTPPMLHDEA
jgi:hypothetical protein